MAQPGWYNTNRNRSYPFLAKSVDRPSSGPLTLLNLPDGVLVDAGFRLGVHAGFDAGKHSVYLARIRRHNDVFYFDFECDAPELFGVPITFTRRLIDVDYLTEFANSEQAGFSLSSISSTGCGEPLWSGFLVSGNMETLSLFLTGDGVIERSANAATIEPGLIQNLGGSYVTSINIANDDRTRATVPAGCPEVNWPYPTDVIFVNARCLLGEIWLKAGYNATVRQSNQENSLTLVAGAGEGAGQPCTEVPLFPGESPPSGSNLLAGGPQCNQTVRSINGIGGQIFNLFGGPGVTVSSVPEQNRVVVDVSMSGLALCFDSISHVSEQLA